MTIEQSFDIYDMSSFNDDEIIETYDRRQYLIIVCSKIIFTSVLTILAISCLLAFIISMISIVLLTNDDY